MGTWTHDVRVNAQTVDVVGLITVRAEENTAATAGFSYNAPKGSVFNPANLKGQSVTIDHNATRIFTGTVDRAVPGSDGLIRIEASDGLLAYFDGLDEAGILAAIPGGHYHEAFFGARTTGWAQAQSVLETVTDEAHMTPNGTLELTSWMKNTTRTITDAVYLSEGTDFADARNQTNRVELTLVYRFTRLKQRSTTLDWVLPWYSDLPTWVATPTTLPTRDMIQAAADGTGWQLVNGIEYVTLPNDIGGWNPTPEQQKTDVIKADLSLFHRWTQPIEETYELNVQAGTRSTPVLTREVALETPFDTASWENSRLAYGPGWSTDPLNDLFFDGADRADLDSLMDTAIAWARHRIASSTRSNYVQFALVADPTITLDDVVAMQTDWILAQGKVYALEHRLDTGQGGVDLTVITLACDENTTLPETVSSLPAPPDSSPTWSVGAIPGMSDTNIGSHGAAPVDDPNWVGYVGNYDPPLGGTGGQIYQGRFRIGSGEIEQESLDPVEVAAAPVEYDAATPGGILSFTPNPL